MSFNQHHIVMFAAENDAIPGGKVGGIGDVIRDIPPALAATGHHVDVVIPSYGAFHRLGETGASISLSVEFRGKTEVCQLIELYPGRTNQVRYWVIDHPLFSVCGQGQIYCNDGPDKPFASDANKFALFSVAGAEALLSGSFGQPDTIHCHDWHSAFVSILREYDSRYQPLKALRCVYSIHNLAIQGIRPFQGDEPSLEAWFPRLSYDTAMLRDPRWHDCVNPMGAAINLSDVVHTVSPSYAEEIQAPNDFEGRGFHGGEGLESIINNAASQGRLAGILNGCDYVEDEHEAISWTDLIHKLDAEISSWIVSGKTLRPIDYLADKRINRWLNAPAPEHIITSVGRLTEQKVRLLTHQNASGETALDRLLSALSGRGVLIVLGSGDEHYESFLAQISSRHGNFLFLNRYAQSVADLLYQNGDLFLMPSSFEPCGISQMLAMRKAQPCLVHAVGGLKDTVADQSNGFHFSGHSFAEQGEALVNQFEKTIKLREEHPVRWKAICRNAGNARFLWEDSARQYVDHLYQSDSSTHLEHFE